MCPGGPRPEGLGVLPVPCGDQSHSSVGLPSAPGGSFCTAAGREWRTCRTWGSSGPLPPSLVVSDEVGPAGGVPPVGVAPAAAGVPAWLGREMGPVAPRTAGGGPAGRKLLRLRVGCSPSQTRFWSSGLPPLLAAAPAGAVGSKAGRAPPWVVVWVPVGVVLGLPLPVPVRPLRPVGCGSLCWRYASRCRSLTLPAASSSSIRTRSMGAGSAPPGAPPRVGLVMGLWLRRLPERGGGDHGVLVERRHGDS